MEDYLEIFRDFEIKKRDVGPSRSGKITIRMPISLMELFEKYTDETLKEAIPQSSFGNLISITGIEIVECMILVRALDILICSIVIMLYNAFE